MQDKLRIGIIGTRGIPNNYGGFEAFAAEVAPRLAQRGHSVTVYCSHTQSYREKMLNGVHLVFRFNPERSTGPAGQFIYDLACNLHSRRQVFDVILHLGYTSDALWNRLWSGRAAHVTNMDGMEWMRAKYSAAVQSFLKHAESWAAGRSDMLVADNPAILDYLSTKYKTPVRHISYGASIPSSYEPAVPGKFGVEKQRYDLVIARMEPENNIETAIAAKLRDPSDIPLLIVANDTGYGRMLRKKYAGHDRIRFPGAVYDPVLANGLRHYARFYIHGHSAGGTNPSLLEAMACGCRILAHDNPYNRNVLAGNGFYFSAVSDLEALLQESETGKDFEGLIRDNLDAIRRNHDWAGIALQYEKMLYEAVGQHKD